MFTNEELHIIQKLMINHLNSISKQTPVEVRESITCAEIVKKIYLFLNIK